MTLANSIVYDANPATRQAGEYGPEDVLALEAHGLYELVDGVLVEKPMGIEANIVAGLVATEFNLYFRNRAIGHAVPEQTFQCFDHAPGRIRRPDVAVVLLASLADLPEGHIRVRPDLAVEVVSPNDEVYELDEKLEDYRLAGVPLVWVLNPQIRKVTVRHADGRILELSDADTLTADPVLPGFSAKVGDLFPALPKSNR